MSKHHSHLCIMLSYNYNESIKGNGGYRHMKKKWIALNEAEWCFILHALNELRTNLINEGRDTDVVDEIMLKIINAPVRKVKIAA